MINFELKLSLNQIHALRTIKEQNDFLLAKGIPVSMHADEKLSTRDRVTYRELGVVNGWFVSSGNSLIREGLAGHTSEMGWHVTEKGRLVLQLIEMEVSDFHKQMQPRKLKQVKAKAA